MASLTQWQESEHVPGHAEGQGSLVCCSPWGCKESDTTEQLNNKKLYSICPSVTGVMSPRSIRVACITESFSSLVEQYFIICVYHVLFICSLVDGHWNCSNLLAIVNNAAMNIGVQISILVPAFNFWGYILRS